jgi:tetratricopeptide (TPR) repeat protein
MSGNVMEWTSTPVASDDRVRVEYVIKGGCWAFSIDEARAWKRHSDAADDLWNALGFRCAADAAPTAAAASPSGRAATVRHPVGRAATAAAAEDARTLVALCDALHEDLDLPFPTPFAHGAELRELATTCLTTAERIGDQDVILRARSVLARVLAAYGEDTGEAVSVAESFLQEARATADERLLGIALLVTGRALCRRNSIVEGSSTDAAGALPLLVQARDVLDALHLQPPALEARIYLAAAQRQLGDADSSLRTTRDALSLAASCSDEGKEARALIQVGAAFANLHEHALALYCFRVAHAKGSRQASAATAAEARLHTLLSLREVDPDSVPAYGAETIEALSLIAPNYIRGAVNALVQRSGSNTLEWVIGNYLGMLASEGAIHPHVSLETLARPAIAVAVNSEQAIVDALPGLRALEAAGPARAAAPFLWTILALATRTEDPEGALGLVERATATAPHQWSFILGLVRVEVLASAAKWDAAADTLAALRSLAEELAEPQAFVAHLAYEARLRAYSGDVAAALDACDTATITALERLDGPAASLEQGKSHLLRSRVLASIGSSAAFIESEAAQLPLVHAGDRLRQVERLICQAQAILDTIEDHQILYDRAGKNLEYAQELLHSDERGATDRWLVCDLYLAAARYFRLGGDFEAAADALQRASTASQDIGHHDVAVASAMDRIELALHVGKPVERTQLETVLSLVERRNRPFELILAYRLAAQVFEQCGDPDCGVAYLERAADLYERVRRTIRSPVLAKDWLRRERGLFEHLVRLHLHSDDADGPKRALTVVRQTKAVSLEELLREAAIVTAHSASPTDADRVRELWREVRRLELALENAAGMVGDELDEYHWRIELNERRRELARLTGPAQDELPHDPRFRTDAVFRLAGPHAGETALLELFITRRRTFVFISAADAGHDEVIELSAPGAAEAMELVQDALADVSDVLKGEERSAYAGCMDRALRTLHAWLLTTPGAAGRSVWDVLREIGARRLLLIPSGPLTAFPLHALYEERDGRRHSLTDDFTAVSYASSVEVLTHHPGGPMGQQVLAVQNPDRSLRHADSEVALLAELLPSTSVLPHDRASKSEVMQRLPEAGIVHFACHSNFSSYSPYESGLKLSDGVLSLAELYLQLELRCCRLVTLSGCESVRLDPKYGDEFLSIASGFSYAGAASVVGSLWPAEDVSTMLLMYRFYAGDRDGGTAAALSAAQRWLRDATAEELAALTMAPPFDRLPTASVVGRPFRRRDPASRPYAHPAFWAPFTYSGV